MLKYNNKSNKYYWKMIICWFIMLSNRIIKIDKINSQLIYPDKSGRLFK